MEERTTLKRTLKPHWVWAIALGASIGWGAFVQPTNWMEMAGPLGVMIGFTIGGLLMMLIAISYGFLIKAFPVSGGEFAYAYLSLGRTHAFISGWFLTLGYLCIVALNASAFALMFKYVFPSVLENFYMYEVAGWEVYGMEIILASVALAVFGYSNIRGGSFSGSMQFIFVAIMIVGVVTITFLVGVNPASSLENAQPAFTPDKTVIAAILSIVAIAPWAFVGFDSVPQAAEEFNFSPNKAFRLIIFAIVFAIGIYCAMVLATAMAAPWQDVVAANHLWGTAYVIEETLGTMGVVILVVALAMGIFTGINGFTISTSRLLFAMSRAKFIPAIFSKTHKKYKTPYISIIFTVIIAMLAPWFGRQALTWVVDMSSVGVTIAYFYTCYTAFVIFRWKNDSNFNPTKHVVAPVKKIFALLGIIASISFLGLLLIPGSPAFLGVESRIALLVWIILGILFYLIKRKDYKQMETKEMNYLIFGEENVEMKNQD
jgi:amino acid transporter